MTEAGRVVSALQLFNDQEVALILGHVVISKVAGLWLVCSGCWWYDVTTLFICELPNRGCQVKLFGWSTFGSRGWIGDVSHQQDSRTNKIFPSSELRIR